MFHDHSSIQSALGCPPIQTSGMQSTTKRALSIDHRLYSSCIHYFANRPNILPMIHPQKPHICIHSVYHDGTAQHCPMLSRQHSRTHHLGVLSPLALRAQKLQRFKKYSRFIVANEVHALLLKFTSNLVQQIVYLSYPVALHDAMPCFTHFRVCWALCFPLL